MTDEDLIRAGWQTREIDGFSDLAGPFWERQENGQAACAFVATDRHANRRGVVHGGMLATFADVALGRMVWHRMERQPIATIQLNMHYVDAVRLGELVELRGEIVRTTRSVVFIRGLITAGGRSVAGADGIWKVLRAG